MIESVTAIPEPETVTEALALLRAEGYTDDLRTGPGGRVLCRACDRSVPASALSPERVYRFEGESDPGDESIVIGASCASCGVKGTLVAAYGPAASTAEASLLASLPRSRT